MTNAEEWHELGLRYLFGDGVEMDQPKAVRCFQEAAERGLCKAQFDLGYCYFTGIGIKSDEILGLKWYCKAAEQGYVDAQFELAERYIMGDGVERDLAKAGRWLRRAADKGLANAQYLLGVGYYNGDTVEQDLVAAVKWFRLAADQGHGRAQSMLAGCYMAGIGVERDPDQGLYWGHRAAETAKAQGGTLWPQEEDIHMNHYIPADIAAKFQAKYDWLKREGVSTLEGALEPGIYKTPDGGWQCNYNGAWGYGCAITLRPGDTEPHEVHGEICKRWYQEGGVFENGKRGWLGYPVSDEESYEGDGNPADRISHFENGDIIWSENTKEARTVKKNNKEMAALNPRRQEIIKPLEGLRSLVKRQGNGLTDSRAID